MLSTGLYFGVNIALDGISIESGKQLVVFLMLDPTVHLDRLNLRRVFTNVIVLDRQEPSDRSLGKGFQVMKASCDFDGVQVIEEYVRNRAAWSGRLPAGQRAERS